MLASQLERPKALNTSLTTQSSLPCRSFRLYTRYSIETIIPHKGGLLIYYLLIYKLSTRDRFLVERRQGPVRPRYRSAKRRRRGGPRAYSSYPPLFA